MVKLPGDKPSYIKPEHLCKLKSLMLKLQYNARENRHCLSQSVQHPLQPSTKVYYCVKCGRSAKVKKGVGIRGNLFGQPCLK